MPTPNAIGDLYARLLAAADNVLRKPHQFGRERVLEELRTEVDRALSGPSEQRLVFPHESILVQALLMAAVDGADSETRMAGQQVAGVLIPWVQEHAFAAMLAQKSERVPTSDGGDYARRPQR